MAEKGSDSNQENSEELQKRIEKLESELENIKKRASSRSETSEDEESQGYSRRKFLKSIGLGTAGLGALAFGSQAAGLRLEPDHLRTLDHDDIIEDDNGYVSIFADYLDADEIDANEIDADIVTSSDEIDAEHIDTNTLDADDEITTDDLDANDIETTNIDASNEVTTDDLDADDIQTTSISTDEINNADITDASSGEVLVADSGDSLEFDTISGGGGGGTLGDAVGLVHVPSYVSTGTAEDVFHNKWFTFLALISEIFGYYGDWWEEEGWDNEDIGAAIFSDKDLMEKATNDDIVLDTMLSSSAQYYIGDYEVAIEYLAENEDVLEEVATSLSTTAIKTNWTEVDLDSGEHVDHQSPLYYVELSGGGGGIVGHDDGYVEDGDNATLNNEGGAIASASGGDGGTIHDHLMDGGYSHTPAHFMLGNGITGGGADGGEITVVDEDYEAGDGGFVRGYYTHDMGEDLFADPAGEGGEADLVEDGEDDGDDGYVKVWIPPAFVD